MIGIHINKVVLAIEAQGFGTVLIQSLLGGPALFKHDQGCAGCGVATILKYPAPRESIDEIEFEFIPSWVQAHLVKIRTKVSAKNIELRLAVFLNLWRRGVRVPYEGHLLPPH